MNGFLIWQSLWYIII